MTETIGLHKDDLPTPALVLQLELFEANIEKMALHARSSSIQLRPHAKTHKCPEIARRQIDAGALGVCVANIFEAESMASEGVRGLLITSELIGRRKVERLVRLARQQPETLSVVDSRESAEELSEAAASGGLNLSVLVDVDPGGRRTGVPADDRAFRLAESIESLPGLALRGIHSYSGASAHVVGFEARKAHSHAAMRPALEVFRDLKKRGYPMEIMSGGSTGTYNIDTELEEMSELQVGSYVFMDVDYRRIGGREGEVYEDFAPALRVLSTVISKNHPDRATVDAGIKAFATDRQFGPEIVGVQRVEFRFGGDEHGILLLERASREVKLGERFEFIVPHCDPNVNLYSQIYCLRGNRVEDVWSIRGRGYPSQA